ncbi:MAG: TIGR01777 family oxidoreductase [Acidobacteriota bacterium]
MEIFPQMVIAGSSGLVGQSLHQHFLASSVSCAVLTRQTAQPGSSEFFWDPYHFQFRQGMRRLSGIRAAIHLSGDNLMDGRWTAAKKQRIRDSRVRTTEAMVQLLSHLEQRPEVLLCASAVGVYGDRGDEILTEDSAAGRGFLPDVCRDWEHAADGATQLGIRVVHLRFGVVLARDGGALAKMLPLFRLGLGGNLGNGREWMSWIALPTVVEIVEFCINHHQVKGPVNVVANPVTNAEFTFTLAHHLRRLAIVPAPAFALRMVFGEMADAALLSSTRAIPAKLLQAGFVFKLPTLQEAFQHLLPA